MKYTLIIIALMMIANSTVKANCVQEKLNILIVTDERKFDRVAFFSVFDSFENIRQTTISHPEILDFMATDSIRTFDAIIFYDMPEQVNPTDNQKQSILKFFEEGAPAIFLHHSLLSYRQWDQFPDIIGGRYYNKQALIKENGDTLQSTYQHDVHYKVNIVNAEHPITMGMKDFDIYDEVYKDYYVKDNVELILSTNHPLSGHALGWINNFGNSRVVFLLNGHGKSAYENKNFRLLLNNAIKWVADYKNKNFPAKSMK